MQVAGWARHPLVWCVLAAVLAVGAYLGAEVYLLDGGVGFPLDDSWIHLTFARNLAAGEGLSYNPGEVVTGSTSPLWTAILSLGFVLPGSPLLWAKALGIGCYLLLVPATYRLGRELALSPHVATTAALLTALTSWIVWAALSGMEILFFALLSVVGMILHLRERDRSVALPVSGLVLSLSALARPEGFFLLLLAALDRLAAAVRSRPEERSRRLRMLGAWFGTVAIVLLPTLVFYRVAGSGFLPTTFAAKSPGLQRYLPSMGYVDVVLGILLMPQPVTTLLAAAGALLLLRRSITGSGGEAVPALWLLGLPLAYSLISPLGPAIVVGNFGRYYFPFFPVVAVVGMVAVEKLVVEPGKRVLRRPGVGLMAAVLLCLPTGIDWARGLERYTRSVLNVEDSDVRMAHWLAERLPREAVLAVNDIGAMGYFLPNRILDLAGIVSPEAHRFYAAAQAAGEPWFNGALRLLEKHRPDYLVVFPSWFPDLAGYETTFREVQRIRIRGNITMGGDELAVYTTPWTRYPLRR